MQTWEVRKREEVVCLLLGIIDRSLATRPQNCRPILIRTLMFNPRAFSGTFWSHLGLHIELTKGVRGQGGQLATIAEVAEALSKRLSTSEELPRKGLLFHVVSNVEIIEVLLVLRSYLFCLHLSVVVRVALLRKWPASNGVSNIDMQWPSLTRKRILRFGVSRHRGYTRICMTRAVVQCHFEY